MRWLLVSSLLVVLSSCDNTLDLIDTQPDLPVVYGLINLEDSIFDVRIEKSFIGEGNIFQLARISDSLYFDNTKVYMELRVHPEFHTINNWTEGTFLSLGEKLDGELIARYPMHRELIEDKARGIFSSNPNYVYRIYREELDLIKDEIRHPGLFYYGTGQNFQIRICIENYNEFTRQYTYSIATSPLIDRPNILNPRYSFLLALYSEQETKLEWQDHGWFYQPSIDFYYQDFNGTHWIDKKIRMPIFQTNRIRVVYGLNEFYYFTNIPFNPDLYRRIGARIDPDEQVQARRFIKMDLVIQAVDPIVKDYIETYTNSSDQMGQPVSNIINGYGVFSVVSAAYVKGFGLDPRSMDSLSLGKYTRHLKFISW